MTIYTIKNTLGDRLALVSRPIGGDALLFELEQIKASSINVLVSLLEAAETRELGLAEEANFARDLGMDFLNFPIPDRGVPESLYAFSKLVGDLFTKAKQGSSIGIHCRMSIGRSGLLAAALLCLSGLSPDAAFSKISEFRGTEVPDTLEQKEWLRRSVEDLRELVYSG